MGKLSRLDNQILVIRDRAKLHQVIDELGDDDLAILLTRVTFEEEQNLQVVSYGQGRETEFLGLFGYGSIILHRTYFTDDTDE